MGLPIDDWFVEFGSEVFEETGERVTEPMLQRELLRRVAREMWQIKCRLLGRGVMSYEMLADSLRIENTALIGLAVRRISHWFNRDKERIFAGTSGWSFKGPAFNEEDLLNVIK